MSGTTPPNADGSEQQPGNQPQYGAPQSGTPPQYGAPQDGAPQYGGPQDGAPQYGGPQNGAPQHGGPQNGAPQHNAPQNGAPQYGGPQNGAPQHGGPQNGTPQFAGAQYGAPFSPPPSQSRGRRVLITVISIVVAIAVAGLVRWGFSAAFGGNAKQDMIASSVAQIRKQSDLPKQVDSVTTWTAVTAEDDAIHYAYTVSSSVDPAAVTKTSVKDSIVPTLCSTDSTRKILDDDIAMRYTYTFDGSSRTMDLTVTKADC